MPLRVHAGLKIAQTETRVNGCRAPSLLARQVGPWFARRLRSFVPAGGNLLAREEAENHERNQQRIEADARESFARGFFPFRRKESDEPKNEASGEDQQGNGTEHKQPNRAFAQSPAAEPIDGKAKAGCKQTEQRCWSDEQS